MTPSCRQHSLVSRGTEHGILGYQQSKVINFRVDLLGVWLEVEPQSSR